tara:strand:- start:214 stop:1347 length:1134 start_codon:yes stop_codon:yes gene_type:complete
MNGLIYHSIDCINAKPNYSSGDLCDFIIQQSNRDLVLTNGYGIRIEGNFKANETGNTRQDAKDVKIDKYVGIHAVCESVSTEFQNVGVVETINEYPRMVSTIVRGSANEDDMNNASNQVELKAPSDEIARQYCRGRGLSAWCGGGGANVRDMDFSFKPTIALNASSGNLPFNKSGYVKISINLAKDLSVFFGTANNDGTDINNYVLSDLRCCYYSLPANPNPPVAIMDSVLNFKTAINSSHTNISARIPASCSAVYMNFLAQASENSQFENNQLLEKLPLLNYCQFEFSSSTSQYISYKIESKSDQLHKFLEAVGSRGHNSVDVSKWKGNDGFGLGLNFNGVVDLSTDSFNVELDSDFDFAGTPYVCYMYFKSNISM